MNKTQHEITLRTRENEVIKRCYKHERYESGVGIIWNTGYVRLFLNKKGYMLR